MRRYSTAVLAAAFALLLSRQEATADVRLQSVESNCSVIKLFERCELTVQISGVVKNPYDTDELTLEASFHPTHGHPVVVQGFYYEPFELATEGEHQVIRSAGKPVWKVRFAARQPGRWTYEVRLLTRSGAQSLPGKSFLVTPSAQSGFVGYDPEHGNFRFDNGQPMIPIGENLCWSNGQMLSDYERWFHDLAQQRINFIRVWMAPWSLRLETKETGVGRYDQLRAWQLDYLLNRSEVYGLYWQLCLLNHGSFSQSQDPDWENNPYNARLGGMCRLPNDFLVDARAKAMFQRLIRYMAARWGSHPQLAIWELFNEADFCDFREQDMILWLREMSTFVRSIDVNRRPVTTSFHKEAPPGVWQFPDLDLLQLHLYDERDFAAYFNSPVIQELKQKFRKPVFIGEFGWIVDIVRKFDDIGIHLHDGIWASLIGGTAGSALVWYWDSYIQPQHLERHYGPLEAFWHGEQLNRDINRLPLALSDANLDGWGRGNPTRAYLWIKNHQHNVDQYIAYRCESAKQRLRQARGQTAEPVTYAPPLIQGAKATVSGLDWLGRYRVEWWDPYNGKITSQTVGISHWGKLMLAVPEVKFDIAAKLIKLHWWDRVGVGP